MMTIVRVPYLATVSLVLALTSAPGVQAQTLAELDAFWAEMSRTVEEGDFEGYSALYHPDAVLVSGFENASYPIAGALARWEQLFVDTRSGAAEAAVSFRMSQRLHDDTTAHETGVFNYRFRPTSGEARDQYVHFQALLVKKDGRWRLVMEYQLSPAAPEEWEALQ